MSDDILPNPEASETFPVNNETHRKGWRDRIASAALPDDVKSLISRVVKRTRLWRREKAEVATELIAHFTDAQDAGVSPDHAIDTFGDPRTAAKLIRRAKVRNRPILWHAWRWGGRAIEVLLLFYGLFFLRFYVGQPRVSVDYVAQLNAPALAVPPEQRAWPLYREALLRLSWPLSQNTFIGFAQFLAEPGNKQAWLQAKTALVSHADAIELIRQATTKPVLGFFYGPDGSAHDPGLGWTNAIDKNAPLAAISPSQAYDGDWFAGTLRNDARMHCENGDANVVEADLNAMNGLAEQWRQPFIAYRKIAMQIDEERLSLIQDILQKRPDLLSDDALRRIAHVTARINRDELIGDLSGDRLVMLDLLQRTYTDDGRGDGRLTPRGLEIMQHIQPLVSVLSPKELVAIQAGMDTGSRSEVMAEYDRISGIRLAEMRKPLRESDWDLVDRELTKIRSSPELAIRYFPIY